MIMNKAGGLVLLLGCLIGTAGTAENGDETLAPEQFSAPNEGVPQASQAPAIFVSEANTHIQSQQFQQALADIEAALTLAPGNSEYRFLRCLLKERLGEPLSLAKTCYTQVVDQLSQGGDNLCETNINCVAADLMAEGSQAERRKQRFLALPASAVESEMRHYVLDGFDRDEYLNTILPQ